MRRIVLSAAILLLASLGAQAQDPPTPTALEDYVRKADDCFQWKVVSTRQAAGLNLAVIELTSQTWRASDEVNQTQWRHWMTFAYPAKPRSEIGFLYIGGGRNGGDSPNGPNERIISLARATGTVVAELQMVPNQPLIFHNDGQPRFEDDLIGYTWAQFLETGDANWPAQLAMVKSAVRAMDAVTAFMASDEGGGHTVNKFVVAGASKRGWTTWLTAAVDKRVVAIVPIVIDVLNSRNSMLHHFAAYGFWSPAVGDYVEHRIMERMNHPRMDELFRLVDPFSYRDRLTMPKLILNASGDQFFLPDSSQFYWDRLAGEKYLRYVPNADHSLRNSDGLQSVVAFYSLIVAGKPVPKFTWQTDADGTVRITTTQTPKEVRLWQADNPLARDFRLETIGPAYSSSVLTSDGNGEYTAKVEKPKQGWRAYFVELTYDVGAAVPLKLTTNVHVAPDVLPFADRDPSQPASITVIAQAQDENAAKEILEKASAFVASLKIANGELISKQAGRTVYLNWRPAGVFRAGAEQVVHWLQQQGASGFRYQLESGRTITAPAGEQSQQAN